VRRIGLADPVDVPGPIAGAVERRVNEVGAVVRRLATILQAGISPKVGRDGRPCSRASNHSLQQSRRSRRHLAHAAAWRWRVMSITKIRFVSGVEEPRASSRLPMLVTLK
jgi:hypothetical protein